MFVPPWLRTAGKGAETQVFKNRLTEAEVSPAGPGAAPAARSSGGRLGTALTASLGPALPVQGALFKKCRFSLEVKPFRSRLHLTSGHTSPLKWTGHCSRSTGLMSQFLL